MIITENFTSAERVLFNAQVDFFMTYEKLDLPAAQQRARLSIEKKRKLSQKLSHFKY